MKKKKKTPPKPRKSTSGPLLPWLPGPAGAEGVSKWPFWALFRPFWAPGPRHVCARRVPGPSGALGPRRGPNRGPFGPIFACFPPRARGCLC